ncbi:MAG: hypothetical protein RIC89_14900 [Pseudomonadales bacterium]
MPNGNPSFDLKQQEAWFAPILTSINAFANSHNLLVEKYYHESPSWCLRFNHPKGGKATIQIANRGQAVATISSHWHLDDYDSMTRSLHFGPNHEVSREPEAITKAIQHEFNYILSRNPGDWNRVVGGYDKVWNRYSKQEFEAMGPHYPDPRS